MRNKHARDMRHHSDRREINDGIVWKLAEHRRSGGEDAAVSEKQCVTVRVRFCRCRGGNSSARATTIVNHNLLSPHLAKTVLDDASEQIGAAAGRRWNQQANRLF